MNESSITNYVEDTMFVLEDGNCKFSLGLTDVLACIEAAILNYYLPRLPKSWCEATGKLFSLQFENDAFYDDPQFDHTPEFTVQNKEEQVTNILAEEYFTNKADITGLHQFFSEEKGEIVVFPGHYKTHDFYLYISDILNCLDFAVLSGVLPKLPSSWCGAVASRHDFWFSEEAQYNVWLAL